MKRSDRKAQLRDLPDQQSHPDPNKNGGKKETTNRHVYVEPGVKIDFVDDLREQQKTSENDQAVNRKKQLFWTKVASALLLLAALFSAWQVKIARDTFNAANRPYVGPSGGQMAFYHVDASGRVVGDNPGSKDSTGMQFTAAIKNYGTVPATEYTSFADWRLNGVAVPGSKSPDRPTILFPGQVHSLKLVLAGKEYRDLMSGTALLQVNIKIDYKGPSKSYTYCTRHQYGFPRLDDFMDLGAMCDEPWATGPSK